MPRRPSDPVSLIPQVWSTAAYERLFLRSDFPVWFRNSAIVTICVTSVRVFFVSLAGYALARLQFRGRGFVFAAVIAVMAVPERRAAHPEVPRASTSSASTTRTPG